MVYEYIKVMPFEDDGVVSLAVKRRLSALIAKNNAKTVIELGSWLGATTRFIAKLLPEDGTVFAIDKWNEAFTPAWAERKGQIYQQFLSNVIHEGLQKKIVPVKTESQTAAKILKATADIIFLDGSYDETQVYYDLKAWLPHLNDNGIICGEGYHENSPGVIHALHNFGNVSNLIVNQEGSFWWYTK